LPISVCSEFQIPRLQQIVLDDFRIEVQRKQGVHNGFRMRSFVFQILALELIYRDNKRVALFTIQAYRRFCGYPYIVQFAVQQKSGFSLRLYQTV
jgi:hypothetical protein